MSRPSSELAEVLGRRLRQLDVTRRRVEELLYRDLLSRRATEHMYEGLFLNAYRSFEGFIEDLFVGLLVEGAGHSSSRADIHPRLKVLSHRVAREVIVGPRGRYVDWLPYERTLELAHLYFRGGRPFTDSPQQLHQQLNRSVALRNAIAHRSRQSQDRFHRMVLPGIRLPPRQRTAAGYLRDIYARNPPQTRYEIMVAQLLSAARILAK